MEILRFGPGFRRPEPPPGTRGLAEKAIWGDPRARVTELSFSRRALIAPQSSPDDGLFIVVAGGGWVQVGDERSPIHHGEAVEWPSGVSHAAWTDGSAMRALLVEVPVLEARHEWLPGQTRVVHRSAGGASGARRDAQTEATRQARGSLAEERSRPEDHDPAEGEPW